MENPKELMVKTTNIPDNSEMAVLKIMAANAAASKLYPTVGPENAILMILLAARELGIPPMQALNGGIWNIKGRVEISSRLMCAMIRRAGHSIKIQQCDGEKCIVQGTRLDNGDSFTAQFSLDDAKKAGLLGRSGPWSQYTEDMLYSRAISRLARRLFPDVIGSAYVEGEIRDSHIEVIEDTTQIKQDIPWEEVETYAEKWGDNKDKFIRYMNEKTTERKMMYSEFIAMCDAHPDRVEKAFKEWLERHSVKDDTITDLSPI